MTLSSWALSSANVSRITASPHSRTVVFQHLQPADVAAGLRQQANAILKIDLIYYTF